MQNPIATFLVALVVLSTVLIIIKGVIALFSNFSALNFFGVTTFSSLLYLWYKIGFLRIPLGEHYNFTDKGIYILRLSLFQKFAPKTKTEDFIPLNEIKFVTNVSAPAFSHTKPRNYFIHNREGKIFNMLPEPRSFHQDWFKAYFEHFSIPIKKGALDDRDWTKLYTEEVKSKSWFKTKKRNHKL